MVLLHSSSLFRSTRNTMTMRTNYQWFKKLIFASTWNSLTYLMRSLGSSRLLTLNSDIVCESWAKNVECCYSLLYWENITALCQRSPWQTLWSVYHEKQDQQPLTEMYSFVLNFFDIRNESRINRPIYPPIGALRCHRGPKIQSLSPQNKISTPQIEIWNQQSFYQSVSFSLLQFIDGALPAAVTWNDITRSVPELPLVKLDGCLGC